MICQKAKFYNMPIKKVETNSSTFIFIKLTYEAIETVVTTPSFTSIFKASPESFTPW